MLSSVMDAEFTEVGTGNKKIYPCPSLLSHFFKCALLAHSRGGTLKQMLALKEGDKFSPNGVMCDVYAKVTGKGRWSGDVFNFETVSSKSWAFCHNAAPHHVCRAFCHPTDATCKISQFITNESKNSPTEFLKYFLMQEDFKEVEIEPQPKGSTKIWQVSAYLADEKGGVVETVFEKVMGNNTIEACSEFGEKYPKHIIKNCSFHAMSVF